MNIRYTYSLFVIRAKWKRREERKAGRRRQKIQIKSLTCSRCCWVFARAQMEMFVHSIAASVMARNQRFRRANSHVHQMRLGNLHIDRNAISPECIYRFLRICEHRVEVSMLQHENGNDVFYYYYYYDSEIDSSELQTQSRGIYLNSSCSQNVHAASSSAFEQSLILSHLK